MRVLFLETKIKTFESHSLLSRPRLRLWDISISFETENETGKLLMVETETETRIWTIFKTETTQDLALDVEIETESLAHLCPQYQL